jgi:Class II Aldolase and Adducin N-terminal domain
LPHRVVIHVHSVNTIAWAVRQDAEAQLTARLAGLRWQWIPYVHPGPSLGREIEKAVSSRPDTEVFVLGNHGLVVCGADCGGAEEILCEVEHRVASSPRLAPDPKALLLEQFARISQWRLPESRALHALGTDVTSRRIVKKGVLYPCQALFLGRTPPLIPCSVPFSEVRDRMHGRCEAWPFLIVEGSGVMVSDKVTRAALAMLTGLTQVVQRIPPTVPIRYLSEPEVTGVLTGDLHGYRQSAESNENQSATA